MSWEGFRLAGVKGLIKGIVGQRSGGVTTRKPSSDGERERVRRESKAVGGGRCSKLCCSMEPVQET